MSFVHLYTGDGEGKTLASLGAVLRAIGHEEKVVILQFLKGRKTAGEYKIAKKLHPNYEIYQFGRKEFINLRKPEPIDYFLAEKGIAFAKEIVEKHKPFLVVLDEINLACAIGVAKIKDVLEIIKKARKNGVNLILTGRKAPKKLIEASDQVSEIKLIKHPFQKGIIGRVGLDY